VSFTYGVGVTLMVILVVIIVVSLMLAFGHRPWGTWFGSDNINDVVAGQDEDDPGAAP
jgi:hypothetical protein